VLRIRIRMFWGLLDTDPDPLERGTDLTNLSIIKQKLDSYCFVTSFRLFIFEK
jgi:hypothetical protein